ncbi:hypothetical protein [Roseivivax isoporae]|uniref:hypothetical protein n=1 Tax=Roseivivax isoporae TaxID=591206 RepID=UPI0012EB3A90|nr:hypothetical protein [Roseivivax isoporae]
MKKKPVHVTFFGASVTEQSVHHRTHERTGFVNVFAEDFAEANGFIVSRVSAGSSDITDGGIVYTEKVIELRPDVCVLDWVTPATIKCDPRVIEQIVHRLLEHNILPVAVFFPRTDRVQKETPIAREIHRIFNDLMLPLYDIADRLDGVPLEKILRDTVHTNCFGARVYAEIILDILLETDLELFDVPKRPPPLYVNRVSSDSSPPAAARNVSIVPCKGIDGPLEFFVVLEQRVGPYSPLLDVNMVSGMGVSPERLETYSVLDPWCHRERQCIKRITGWHHADGLRKIILSCSSSMPPLAKRLDLKDGGTSPRHLKPRGDMFVVSNRRVSFRAIWS